MADYLTFLDLTNEVTRAVRALGGAKADLIKAMINMTYFEMLACDDLYPLYWLVDFDDTLAAVAPGTITGISKADPGVITVDAVHGLTANVDIVGIFGIAGMTTLNNRLYLVNATPATTTLSLIDLDSLDAIDTSALTAWSSGGMVHHMGKVLGTTGRNVQRIISAQWANENPMTEITPEELANNPSFMHDSTGLPNRYRHRKKFESDGTEINQLLWFYGADQAYDLRYWAEMRGSKLSADADVPLLPPQAHYGIAAGTIMRLEENQVQVENPSVWPGIYQASISFLQSYNRKFWQDNDQAFRRKVFML